MTVDYGMASSPDGAGYYVGFLVGAYMFGRMCGAIPWGIIADRYGRYRVLQMCTVLSGVLTILFGYARALPLYGFLELIVCICRLSPNYFCAVVLRCANGAVNPVLALCRSVMPQIAPPDKQSSALRYNQFTLQE